MVEALTRASLPHLPPLTQTRHWEPVLAEAQHMDKKSVRRAESNSQASLWLKTAHVFRSAYGGGGNQLEGVQDEDSVRYMGELSGLHSKEYRFALFPHLSGFESSQHDGADSRGDNNREQEAHADHSLHDAHVDYEV